MGAPQCWASVCQSPRLHPDLHSLVACIILPALDNIPVHMCMCTIFGSDRAVAPVHSGPGNRHPMPIVYI